jgi:hypothetical protein
MGRGLSLPIRGDEDLIAENDVNNPIGDELEP